MKITLHTPTARLPPMMSPATTPPATRAATHRIDLGQSAFIAGYR
jgi:hypothetical protein